MAETEVSRALQMRVQVAWEQAMDIFYEKLDKISAGSTEIQDSDVVSAIGRQIDWDTARSYQDWING